MASRPDPDRLLAAALYGTARRLAAEDDSIAEVKLVLGDLADGRYDLLAREAGLMAGYWSVAVQRTHPVELLTAGLLVVSGSVDLPTVAEWVEVGRRRGSAPLYRAR